MTLYMPRRVSTSINVSYCNNKLSLGNESNIIIIIIISRCERPLFLIKTPLNFNIEYSYFLIHYKIMRFNSTKI